MISSFYAIGMLLVALSLRAIYGIYCGVHFKDCRFKFLYDKQLYLHLFSFTGWNVFGASAGILNTYGINILVNLFFGVSMNAARGIADQVSHAVNHFSGNFTMALSPQITKSFSSGDYAYTSLLIYRGAKYSALLLWFFGLPVILQVDYILNLWLVEVPAYAPVFVNLALLYSLCNALSLTLYYGILATGDIKAYHIVVTTINLMAFPICYIAFTCGYGAEWGYLSAIVSMLLSLVARGIMLKRKLPMFTLWDYTKDAFIKVVAVMVITYLLLYPINHFGIVSGFIQLLLITAISVIVNGAIIYIIAIDASEKAMLKKLSFASRWRK